MGETIDYFYSHVSPWAYLGHDAVRAVAEKHGAVLRARPVDLSGVFDASGGLPLGKRHPARQAYRFIELQRWKDKRGVPLSFKPKFFPTKPGLADRSAIALAQANGPVLEFSAVMFRAIWAEDLDIAGENVVRQGLEAVGVDPDEVISKAEGAEVIGQYQQNQQDAVDAGVIGSPCYVLKGEPFWGQDRIDLLEEALISGRPGYTSL
ncbi:2-hydroxychromene-2-carboxylate isomerase [Roseibium polysiphoniae]|uniref:2-hydroxychromene-2-carboxylate isomerase n=1 Tax=Roseibium polysiphoniae TaxID=2571221 RepID=A0A944CE47_9HYPH|nr:2-hydroxychromene-2-carboxylate isomerase [Roseibium polysiphoniae]MBS8261163.1 2-hydroxychromene-2-carboxylate isomerase [Roseibium polysiphoniae]